ncbi:uncharacterized protein LOC120796165 [Xiphias gladius]|uniref:uncharacterized protein LOC120796165 n=1 Tax=Xiphias gladius TaxID=8245 RepID=UPI001A98745C|nr:uncharacterized protein LOC120796165 [Xiphias gladius]
MLLSLTLLTDMAVHHSFLVILAALTGIHSITAVSEVSVKAGESITIPCLYDSQYINHVKYLCGGYYFASCSYVVKTNQNYGSGRFSISDDKKQRIFTVTIKDLTDQDTHYWCSVEINRGRDVGQYFHLSVTRGSPRLYVDHQEIKGFNGHSVNISCKYRNAGEKRFCRLGGNCVTGTRGSIDGTTVTITTRVPGVFTVTMSGLTTKSSGWYSCATGDLQMPVHLTVTAKPTTTTHATTGLTTTTGLSPPRETVNPSVSEDDTRTSSCCSFSIHLKSIIIIPLSVLLFILMVALFIWYMLKGKKQNEAESSFAATAEENMVYSTVKCKRKPGQHTGVPVEEEVIYSNVQEKRKPSRKMSDAKSDVEIIYSSVVTVKQQTPRRVEEKPKSVR